MSNMTMKKRKKKIIRWSHISQFYVPDELFADGAEGRLREERGAELVTFDHVDFGLFDGSSALVEREQTFALGFGLGVSVSLTGSV